MSIRSRLERIAQHVSDRDRDALANMSACQRCGRLAALFERAAQRGDSGFRTTIAHLREMADTGDERQAAALLSQLREFGRATR
jgi:hypothetical protein